MGSNQRRAILGLWLTLAGCSQQPSGPQVDPPLPDLTTVMLDGIPRGWPYLDSLRATAGNGTFTFGVATGALPAGLTLTSGGEVSGVVETLGVYSVGIAVTSGGQVDTFDVELKVRDFNPIATTFSSTCALRESGIAYCWGENVSGAIGDGSNQNRVMPVPVVGGRAYMQLTAGVEHVCALTPQGAVFCWGFGALSPVEVSSTLRFLQVSAGRSHTCALTEAYVTYCWGDNTQSQLGRSGAGSNTPSVVQGGDSFVRLAAGRQHMCAFNSAGAVYCWGEDILGELGDGTVDSIGRAAPAPITLLESFRGLDGGWSRTCGLTAAGGWCWGQNAIGAFGNGEYPNGDVPHPNPVSVLNSSGFDQLVTNTSNSCALDTDGYALCWGGNGYGNLGVGTATNPILTPTPVVGGRTYFALELGMAHQCAVELDWDVYCWGQNGSGELGDGTQVGRQEPTLVSGLP
jgi:alpha-tubulin suppressor-like RCC1 family protein